MKGPLALSLVALLAGGAACSAILDLEPPPEPGGSTPDATVIDGAGDDSRDAAATDAAAPIPDAGDASENANDDASAGDARAASPVCVELDAGEADASVAYAPLGPALQDAGSPSPWTFYGVLNVDANAGPFSGGTFDGRYVYFAPALNGVVTRVDTTLPANFRQAATWSTFDVASLADAGPPLGGFSGAVFDGRYVYFVPHALGGAPTSVVVRYDTTGAFASPASWSRFDLGTVTTLGADAGGAPAGYAGGVTDGRAVYFVPNANAAGPSGRVVRYTPAPGDAGPDLFANAAAWSTFDVTATNPGATGFAGAAFDGKALYLVPSQNGGLGNGGLGGVAARYRVDAGFTSVPSGWSAIDLTTINGEAVGFSGAAFDGRYVYFVPRSRTIALRLDTTSSQPASPSAWSARDLGALPALAADAGGITATAGFGGAAFDGRFVYYIPSTPGFGTLVRYDTRSTFGSDCAWSSVDLAQVSPFAAGYYGAVFDGQYLYLVPRNSGFVARFDAKTPASLPALPAFHGSFY